MEKEFSASENSLLDTACALHAMCISADESGDRVTLDRVSSRLNQVYESLPNRVLSAYKSLSNAEETERLVASTTITRSAYRVFITSNPATRHEAEARDSLIELLATHGPFVAEWWAIHRQGPMEPGPTLLLRSLCRAFVMTGPERPAALAAARDAAARVTAEPYVLRVYENMWKNERRLVAGLDAGDKPFTSIDNSDHRAAPVATPVEAPRVPHLPPVDPRVAALEAAAQRLVAAQKAADKAVAEWNEALFATRAAAKAVPYTAQRELALRPYDVDLYCDTILGERTTKMLMPNGDVLLLQEEHDRDPVCDCRRCKTWNTWWKAMVTK